MSARRLIFMESVPREVRRTFQCLDVVESGEVNLWRECLSRVVLDAVGETGISKNSYHNKLVREARNFVRFDRFFPIMCDFAGVEPDAIRGHILRKKPFMYPEKE